LDNESARSPWPSGRTAAVSLTFDDGMTSQLQTAIPMLNDLNLQATFYVNPRGENWQERMAPWAEVARTGHEIGNHSLTHPCSRNFNERLDAPCLERMSLDDVEADVTEAERRLRAVIPGDGPRSFCYPCYLSHVGEGERRQSYTPVIARHFIAARAKGERPHNHPLTCDLHHLWSFPAERSSGAFLIGLVEASAAIGRWVVFTFHGVLQGHLSINEVDLKELAQHLDRSRDRLWTAPVATVAQGIVDWRRAIGRLDPADR